MNDVDLSDFLNPGKAVVLAKIRDSMKVADFGVGAGFFTRALARAVGPSGKVYAIDVHRGVLKALQPFARAEGLENIEYVQGDLEERHGSALPDDSMEVVLIANILFQIQNKEAVVEEAWRILRKGGRAVVIDWKESFNNIGPHKDHVCSRAGAEKLFTTGGGFELLEEIPAGTFHYGLIFKKNV